MAQLTGKIDTPSVDVLIKLFGAYDENINVIKKILNVEVVNINGELNFIGEEKNVELAREVVKKIVNFIIKDEQIDTGRVTYICEAEISRG